MALEKNHRWKNVVLQNTKKLALKLKTNPWKRFEKHHKSGKKHVFDSRLSREMMPNITRDSG